MLLHMASKIIIAKLACGDSLNPTTTVIVGNVHWVTNTSSYLFILTGRQESHLLFLLFQCVRILYENLLLILSLMLSSFDQHSGHTLEVLLIFITSSLSCTNSFNLNPELGGMSLDVAMDVEETSDRHQSNNFVNC